MGSAEIRIYLVTFICIAVSDKSGRTDFESGGKGAVPLTAALGSISNM